MMRGAAAAGALVALVACALALPDEAPPGTFASLSDARSAQAYFEVEIPEERRCVLWARSASAENALHVAGSRNVVEGCLHSNGELRVTGARGTFSGPLRHGGALAVEGNGNDLQAGAARVGAMAEPHVFRAADYAPGGVEAERANATGHYFVHPPGARLRPDELAPGIHYGAGDLTVAAGGAAREVTLVAEGSLRIETSDAELRPYARGLLAGSWSGGVEVSGHDARLRGALYAPHGLLHLAGASHQLVGWACGDRVLVSASQATLVAENPFAFGRRDA